jgi:hypothetical protein
MATGNKSITPIPAPAPTGTGITGPCNPMTLSRYAEIVGMPSLFFWGVYRGSTVPEHTLFTSGEVRQKVSQALDDATRLIESQGQLRLCPSWEIDRHAFSGYSPVQLRWKQFIESGIRAFSVYEASALVVYTGDFGTVTVAHGGVGTVDEVAVFYNDGLYTTGPEPSNITYGTTHITITFPRERLVKPSLMSTGYYKRESDFRPVAWETISNFVTSISVARIYNDPSSNAVIRVRRNCRDTCETTTQTGCVKADDAEFSWVDVNPARYSGGSWLRTSYCGVPEFVTVYYHAGAQSLPADYEQAVIRLAHTLLPDAPCPSGTDPWHRYWKRDREVLQPVTREVRNCPWGSMDGAWFAWNVVGNSMDNYGHSGGWMGSKTRRVNKRWRRASRWLW